MNNYLKYPLYLFIIIFVAKFGYIVVESFYNYYVLTTTTSIEMTKEIMEQLNKNGHMISSVGITLLLVPFYYLVVKRINTTVMYSSLLIASILTYFLTYNLLNKAIDSIVESNKEKRHDAYYVNIFKYGILNNIFSYNSFIDSKKVEKDKLEVNDRILLTNSFLLLHADKKLISKLKERGKKAVAEVYISKYDNGEYERSFTQYKNATAQIQDLWSSFNTARNGLDKNLKKLESEKIIKQHHQKLIDSVKSKYSEYQKAWKKVDKKIANETTQNKVNSIKEELNKYYANAQYSQAQEKYEEKMFEKFGHFVRSDNWLNNEGYLTSKSIKRCIKSEIEKGVMRTSKLLRNDMDARSFFNHIKVKTEVAKRLKQDGIGIPKNFNYSYAQFKKYYNIMSIKKYNDAPKQFYKKLKAKIGKNDLKLHHNWNQFMDSKFIRGKIITALKTKNTKEINKFIKAIKTKDLANFKKMIYLPKVQDKISEMMYKEKDFLDKGKAARHGDEAIKLLYIPPFALAISILALLLNTVTVLGMTLQSFKLNTFQVNGVKVLFIVLIVSLPVISKFDGFENKLIQKVSNPEIQTYLKFLNWISYYESINYNIHK